MDEELELVACHACQTPQPFDYKFCGNCGSKNLSIFKVEMKRGIEEQENLKMLAIYSSIVALSLILNFIFEDSLTTLVGITVGFAAIDIVFAVLQPDVWKAIFRTISLKPFFWIVPSFIFSAFLVSYLMDHLNLILFDDFYLFSYLDYFSTTDYPLLYAIVLIAVFPAIFEELAFRGFLFNNLKKLSGANSALWGSSFLFALVHFSLLSLIWIFPFGLLLGYLRKKYDTILYGVVAHFIHNSTVVCIEYYIGNWAI